LKLPLKPRVLFIAEPHTGPFEYIFAKFDGGFLRLGCHLHHFDIVNATPESFRRAIEQSKADVIFGLLRHPWAIRKVADLLQDYHPVPALNWFQEDPNFLTSEILEASRHFDFWFTQDYRTVSFWPTRAFFSPHAFDETIYRNLGLVRDVDVSFVGQLGNPKTAAMLWPYVEEIGRYGRKALVGIERPMGLPFLPGPFERLVRSRKLAPFWRLYPFWKCIWETPTNEVERSRITNRSKIHFGLNRVRGAWEESVRRLLPDYPFDKHGLFCQTKGRLFHAVGTGALALTDHVPELDGMFEVGKEIITFEYGQMEDFREKLRWYLTHDSEREKIARAGYLRAHRDHTFVARIEQIFRTVRLNGS
jgi:hypothetical protein